MWSRISSSCVIWNFVKRVTVALVKGNNYKNKEGAKMWFAHFHRTKVIYFLLLSFEDMVASI